jgi:hypothetical protein
MIYYRQTKETKLIYSIVNFAKGTKVLEPTTAENATG